jgi:urease accessory protein
MNTKDFQMKPIHLKIVFMVLMACFVGAAQAHPDHVPSGFSEGLGHPLGWDHMVAMVAVGGWAVLALPIQRVVWGPAVFLTSMVLGALLGFLNAGIPVGAAHLEALMTLSAMVLALMVFVPLLSQTRWAVGAGFLLVATAAALHGLAHGIEAPATAGGGAYVVGFVLTTAALHFMGGMAAWSISRLSSKRTASVLLGSALGGVGVYLFGQLI